MNMEKESSFDKEAIKEELGFILARINRKLVELGGETNAITEKAQELRDKYPDYAEYELYHLLVGSTPKESLEKFDFPGSDSIERFIMDFDY
jgi:hypothetical protein